jgi:hypothetical protein
MKRTRILKREVKSFEGLRLNLKPQAQIGQDACRRLSPALDSPHYVSQRPQIVQNERDARLLKRQQRRNGNAGSDVQHLSRTRLVL